jgi:hypothetical protein
VRVELYATVEDQFRSARKQIASFLLPSETIAGFLQSDEIIGALRSAGSRTVPLPSEEHAAPQCD